MTDLRQAAQAVVTAWKAGELGLGIKEFSALEAALAAQKAPGFTEMVPIEVYEAAVRGRQEMRDALREEREKTKNLTRALGEAVNGPTFMGEPVIAHQAAQPVACQPTPEMNSAVRKTLQHHGLTKHGDGVVEADLIHAVLKCLPAQPQQDTDAGEQK